MKQAYQFNFLSIDQQTPLPLKTFAGKVILIVNVASQCGFTPQYKALEALYQKYKDKGFVILGIPSNDFGKQEPGEDEAIKTFCELNFGVTFPLTSKTHVIGKEAHPFYQWAKNTLGFWAAPKWNFHKYLIDQEGNLVDYFYSTTKPDSNKITTAIENLINRDRVLP